MQSDQLGPESSEEELKAAWKLAHHYALHQEYEKATFHYRQLAGHPSVIANPRALATLQVNLGLSCEKLGRETESEECYLQAILSYEKLGDHENCCQLNLQLAQQKLKRALFNDAEQFAAKAHKHAAEIGDLKKVANVLFMDAEIALGRKDFNKAAACYMMCRQMFEDTGLHKEAIGAIWGMGMAYWQLGAMEDAEKLLLKAYKYTQIHSEDTRRGALALDLGKFYRAQLKLDQAKEVLEDAVRIQTQSCDHILLKESLYQLAIANRGIGDYRFANAYLQELLQLSEESSDLVFQACAHANMGANFEQLKDKKNVMSSYEKAKRLYKQLDSTEELKRVLTYEIKFLREMGCLAEAKSAEAELSAL